MESKVNKFKFLTDLSTKMLNDDIANATASYLQLQSCEMCECEEQPANR